MTRMQLRIRSADRGPLADEAVLRAWLVGLVTRTLDDKGGLPSGAVIVRSDSVDVADLRPVVQARHPLQLFLAGMAGTETARGRAEAVGVVGRFGLRRRGAKQPVHVALVFVEWSDGRWWQWQALLAQDGASLLDDTLIEREAELGDPLPDGLGRWWTLARRRNLRVRLEAHAPDPAPIVH
jgi:hypothetical protein